MTLYEVIQQVNGIKPNAFDNSTKASWINEVEGLVQTEVFLLDINDVTEYKYSYTYQGSGISFPDDNKMVFAESVDLPVGGSITISGLVTYSGNNSNTPRKIIGRSADRMTYTFADNSFSATGETGDTGTATVTYNGSNAELLVPNPHSKIYWTYLSAMIDFANGEYDKYNNTLSMFNGFFSEYMRWFANRYRPADGKCEIKGYYLSAYAIAVKHGYTGTEEEWLLTLKGDKGDKGAAIVSTTLIGQDPQGGNIYQQTFDDGTTAQFTAPKGSKGDTGDQGNPGASAGFGTPTISVDSNTGTPSATITATGPDTQKIFSFEFHNLKGEPGTAFIATVNTTSFNTILDAYNSGKEIIAKYEYTSMLFTPIEDYMNLASVSLDEDNEVSAFTFVSLDSAKVARTVSITSSGWGTVYEDTLARRSDVTSDINTHNSSNSAHQDIRSAINGKSTVSVSGSGTSTEEVQYITIDGVEKKLAGSSGTTSYNDLTDKPSINGTTLSGNVNLQTPLTADVDYTTPTALSAGLATREATGVASALIDDHTISAMAHPDIRAIAAGKSTVSVSASGTSTDEVQYITVNGVEKKLAGGGTTNYNELSNRPSINGTTLSGNVNLQTPLTAGTDYATPSNVASSVSTHDSSNTAHSDIRTAIGNIECYIGYTSNDIYGVEVDFANKTFTRLAGAIGKSAGSDFNTIAPWSGRRRCNLSDAGVVNAYYGGSGYVETGANGQVMVEQPAFYYKVVPLSLTKNSNGAGFHMRKARYYVSATPKEGFKRHPAFIQNGVEKQKIYLSAYEGSTYDVSANAYNTTDAQTVDWTNDKLASIANAKPTSGLSQGATRAGFRTIAAKRGTGWSQQTVQSVSASQLLFLIEYGHFNTQSQIGRGVVDKTDDGSTNMSNVTGATSSLGNSSGMASGTNGLVSVSYRGEENIWGNIWKWVDGINIYPYSVHHAYIADHGFADNKGTDPYKDAGFTLSFASGYVSAFGYSDEEYDWLFLPSECSGNDSLPVGDYFWQDATYASSWRVARLGAYWYDGSAAGCFCWYVNDISGFRVRAIGGRLLFVPQ